MKAKSEELTLVLADGTVHEISTIRTHLKAIESLEKQDIDLEALAEIHQQLRIQRLSAKEVLAADCRGFGQLPTNSTLESKRIQEKSINDLEFSVRTHNSLEHFGIKTLGEILCATPNELLRVKNFGRKSLKETSELFEQLGAKYPLDEKERDKLKREILERNPNSAVAKFGEPE